MLKKAENKFFNALKSVLGEAYVQHNSKPPIVRINTKYEKNYYQDSVNKIAKSILKDFNSTYDFSNTSISSNGAIIKHPQLGTRLVEFDEYQHLTPMRARIIELSQYELPLDFYDRYLKLIRTQEIKDEVQKKTSRSGYRAKVAGFRFEEGRMYQRAFYAFLKDYAHLSEGYKNFSPIIRFAMPDFKPDLKAISHAQFLKIPDNEFQDIISQELEKWRTK